MAKSKTRKQQSRRRQASDSRRRKRIVHTFREDDHVDYKDIALLRKFMSDRGKIRARRVSGACAGKRLANTIKASAAMVVRCCVIEVSPDAQGAVRAICV